MIYKQCNKRTIRVGKVKNLYKVFFILAPRIVLFLHCISIIYVGDGQKSVPTRETGDCCDDHKTHAYFASEEMERN